MAIYVLLHGAWSGGWQWKEVAFRLLSAGHEVYTPTLTGVGERVHLASPDIGLDTHVQDVLGVLKYEALSNVILVAHSYSGVVATAVVEQVPEKIGHLVYVDAFVPQDGQSLKDILGADVWAFFEQAATTYGAGWRIPHDPPDADRRTDALINPCRQPVTVKSPLASTVPRTFIYSTDKSDLGPIGAGITRAAARAKVEGWGYHELNTGHMSMWTMSEPLSVLLLELA